jgi:hypothetical protein
VDEVVDRTALLRQTARDRAPAGVVGGLADRDATTTRRWPWLNPALGARRTFPTIRSIARHRVGRVRANHPAAPEDVPELHRL